MAKRGGAGKSGIVVAQEIRALIEANNTIKGPEVMAALREKFPKETFNDKSCQVSYANIRKSMGLSRTLKKKPGASKAKAGRPPGRPVGTWRPSTAAASTPESAVDISLLQAAKALLQHCNGDAAVAAQALKQIAALQMS
ncbi:MAG: hypothetical protein H7Z17_05410 [Fuerstia sp.]|nr:hypothetical protein [Fuerstiella sp.]